MMKRSYRLTIIVVLQILFLFNMIGFKYFTLYSGTPVLLKTAPVDPWDVFRGEFIRLDYEISRIKRYSVKDDLSIEKQDIGNKTLYVVLEKKDKYWSAVSIHGTKPQLNSNQVFIKARPVYYDNSNDEYRLSYGIETFYVPEGEGKKLQLQSNLDAVVKVDRFGNAVIENIISRKE